MLIPCLIEPVNVRVYCETEVGTCLNIQGLLFAVGGETKQSCKARISDSRTYCKLDFGSHRTCQLLPVWPSENSESLNDGTFKTLNSSSQDDSTLLLDSM